MIGLSASRRGLLQAPVFAGLFMGLGASFSVLVVVEMMGLK
jgi:hypothetical protein